MNRFDIASVRGRWLSVIAVSLTVLAVVSFSAVERGHRLAASEDARTVSVAAGLGGALSVIRSAVLGAQPVPITAAPIPLWSEEFDAGPTLDDRVWSFDLGSGGWGNLELQTYSNDLLNARVAAGRLLITAREEWVGQRRTFTSARVKTEDKVTVRYGTIEARIKGPDLADGLWPAFWLLGNSFSSVGWPDCGEIDVMEMGHLSGIQKGLVNRRVMSAAHWEFNGQYAGYGRSHDAPRDLDGSYHIYRMEWTPRLISTYIDDAWIWSMDISDPDSFGGHEFHEPHFFILNVAVGGTFTGLLDPDQITAPFPAELEVDYIRVYDNGYTELGGSAFK
ncbi:MAG: family 16 glycosylhydrolase [Phycisphaerales bacterium]